MFTYVIGFKPKDEKFESMKLIYDTCEKTNIPIPQEVIDYFGDEEPNDIGVRVELPKECQKEWCDPDQAASGIEIDVRKLPKDVYIIRFINSW